MTNLIIMDGIDNSPAKLDSLHICGESRKYVTCDFLDSG